MTSVGEVDGASAKRWIIEATCSLCPKVLATAGVIVRRREGPFHDDHRFHHPLHADHHASGLGIEGVMASTAEVIPGELGVRWESVV
jgi:hypothetical protein